MKKNRYGFTLLELMIVIIILGVLATLISGNFVTSLKKGRDARRKTDLQQIQRALEMYYEDNRQYPAQIDLTSGGKFCHPSGCDTKVYMQKVPVDTKCTYYYEHYNSQSANGEGYELYSILENDLDQGSGVNQSGYSGDGINCGTGCTCKFKIGSSNYP